MGCENVQIVTCDLCGAREEDPAKGTWTLMMVERTKLGTSRLEYQNLYVCPACDETLVDRSIRGYVRRFYQKWRKRR